MSSRAYGINNAEQVVGESVFGGLGMATEWSGDSIINLGSLPGSTSSVALAINGSGKAVGISVGNVIQATEWSGGSLINLGGLAGSADNFAAGINDAGQVVGGSVVGNIQYATEWSGGNVINLGGLPGSTASFANGINDAGQVVGNSTVGGVHTPPSGATAGSSTSGRALPSISMMPGR
jgi:probable HAF family extracellular repeat protein